MKSYLNRQQRSDYITLAHMISFCEVKLLKWYDYQIIDKDEKKRLKTIITHGTKVLGNIINRLDDDAQKQVKSGVLDLQLLLCTTERAEVKFDEVSRADGCIKINQKYVYDVMELAMERCKGCNNTNYRECCLRSCAMEMDVPIANDEQGKCQYNC